LSRQRLVYLSNAIDDATCIERGIFSDSPAATNKVLQLSSALKSAGCHVIILSLGRGQQNKSWKFWKARVKRIDRKIFIFAPFLHAPLFTHIISAIGLLHLVWRLLRFSPSPTCFLVYNRLAHYLPALELARLFGCRLFLDLEDGDVSAKFQLKSLISVVVGKRINFLCNAGALLAASTLASQYSGSKIMCCYGVAYPESQIRDWTGPIRVLLGGSLIKETGISMFIDAIRLLRNRKDFKLANLEFFVTGMGEMAVELKKIEQEEGFPRLNFLGRVSRKEYSGLIKYSNVGLCLKLISSDLGLTTFPSKIIEITASGMLLLTTRVSDVPLLLSNDEALYLSDENPQTLADNLCWIINNRGKAETMAQLGAARIQLSCSELLVGKKLMSFFFDMPNKEFIQENV